MNLLPSLPLWLAGLILVGLCLLGSEFGQWAYRKIGAWRPDPQPEEKGRVDMEGFIIGSVFGLFAFILGFTFSIAIDRFDARRLLVAEEANAINTSFLRAELLDEPHRLPMQVVLREYAHVRIAPRGFTDDQKASQVARSNALRDRLWNVTRSGVWPYRGTDLGVSVAEGMNEVLNVGTRRELAGRAHIPDRIMNAMLFYLIISSALLGYLTARQSYRLRAASSLLFVLMSMTIVVILDLDRPRSGAILTPQTALENLVARLDKIRLQQPRPH